ncbi:hypothetical protein [Klebsiella pneumoniae]|uniref:hypothetical protein n=1 Tax=Klebsiella pneumoniae TaxID=573 RepID=UPI000F21B3D4|nr:hypothetical protein [Klebsiella pneumoniae]VCZ91016.1 hypothetical protein BANRA_05583 [Klebsiella pneumoniae]
MIVGVTTVSAVAIVGGNLIADLVLPWVDPRIDVKSSREDDENALLTMAVAAACFSYGAQADEKTGGDIVVTYQNDVATLDPAIGYDWQNWSMIKSLFDGLMDYRPAPPSW